MDIATAWVKPPQQINGLDHLGVQAPCINLYGQMLPGITNVTDRARYYSFYPWLIWALEQEGIDRYDEFFDLFRRADCLFSMIAERHAHAGGGAHEDHAAAVVGANTFSPRIRNLDAQGMLRLSDFATTEPVAERYFANKMGGLGQYYLGVLREQGILAGNAMSAVQYTRPHGETIALRMDGGVDRHLFIETLRADTVDQNRLDALDSFCHCRLKDNPGELGILRELFWGTHQFQDIPGSAPRRSTLNLILSLGQGLVGQNTGLTDQAFRACTYSGHLPGAEPWGLPKVLEEMRRKWAIYGQNELLSIALQGLFFAVLNGYEAEGNRLSSPNRLVRWFLDDAPEVADALSALGSHGTVRGHIESADDWLPEIAHWEDPGHEIQRAEAILTACAQESAPEHRAAILEDSLRILITLAARQKDGEGSSYAGFEFARGYFDYYPINLASLHSHARDDWAGLDLRDLLGWLLERWAINAHLRVALRKLRDQGQSTFRIRPSDRGMEIVDPAAIPPAVHTQPRIRQALRILKDLAALERQGEHRWVPGTFGIQSLEAGNES